jgi:hypothetical protein
VSSRLATSTPLSSLEAMACSTQLGKSPSIVVLCGRGGSVCGNAGCTIRARALTVDFIGERFIVVCFRGVARCGVRESDSTHE